jgi:adenine phosphoribosyltransferase
MSAPRPHERLRALVRTIPDYPKPGILFRDVTTVLKDPAGFQEAVDAMVERHRRTGLAKVAGIEARGFILGGAVARGLDAGFIPVRKRGKLPAEVYGHDYALEYGTDRVEMHLDAVGAGERVLVVDDLIATGGTAEAAVTLVRLAGGEVVEACFLIELPELGGRARLERLGVAMHSLIQFDGH